LTTKTRTVGLLNSAHKFGGSKLKRVVVLGSAVSCLDSFQDPSVAGKDYTERDWNPVTSAPMLSHTQEREETFTDRISQVTAAQAIESGNPVLGYNASKKLAEEAAWRFMEEEKPVFDLTVINPDIIIGPMLQPVRGPTSVNETNKFAMYNFMNGEYKQIDGLTFPFYHFVSAIPR
jgi:nucleoside-diphosphate-sugar epimerase